MTRIFLIFSACFAAVRHPLRTLKALAQGIRTGIEKGREPSPDHKQITIIEADSNDP